MDRFEVAIVGAGPIGLEMAVALKQAGVGYLHLEAKQIGYTVSWFAPQTRFFSSNERIAIAGVPLVTPDQSKASREQYLAYLRSVVQQFDLKVNTYERVLGIEHADGGFELRTEAAGENRHYWCAKLILATGGTDRPRRLGVPGEDLPHVSHYFEDPHTYFGRRLLIVGGKNSAIEATLRSHHAGAQVAISYRREKLPERHIKYWLIPETLGLIGAGRIEAYFSSEVVAISRSRVTLRRGVGEHAETFEIPADFVLALIGYEQDNTLFKLAGLKIEGSCGAPAFDERTMETSVPGIYVAGTAVGGTQEKYGVFIENCHVHVHRILAAITGTAVPQHAMPIEQLQMPES
jgi:thioredoxin reductase (NADPH)